MGLESKHRERDLNLPKHRQKLIEAIEIDLKNDCNVLAVFYGGSIGAQNTDLYSDIDLRLVVKEEVFEEYRLNKKQRAKNWGTVLFFEDYPWATHSVAHYDYFIKVDSFYYKMNDMKPSVWLQNIKIVHDPTGLMKEGNQWHYLIYRVLKKWKFGEQNFLHMFTKSIEELCEMRFIMPFTA